MSPETHSSTLDFVNTSQFIGEAVISDALAPLLAARRISIDSLPANTWLWAAQRIAQNTNSGLVAGDQ